MSTPNSNPSDQIPAALHRQLERLEQLGNAEAALSREEHRAGHPAPSIPKPSFAERSHRVVLSAEEHHRLSLLRLRREREAKRVRAFGCILLGLSPVFTVAYVIFGHYQQFWLSAASMLIAGFLVGFASICLYFANQKIQEI